MNLDQLLTENRFLVVLGRGGVGKTTVSASLAIRAATLGRKTVVVTIDPANRLADALGIDQTMKSPTKVTLTDERGELFGLMMDRRETCDELVSRFSTDENMKVKIFSNPYYQHFSTSLAGGQEYMAIEKVRQLLASNEYDLVVLDTPPAIHAFDFLDAPKRFISGLKRIPSANESGSNTLLSRLKKRGGQLVLDGLKRFTGGRFLHDLTSFLSLFRHVLSALETSSKTLEIVLRQPTTSFVYVDVLDRGAKQRLTACKEALKVRKMKLSGLIYNRSKSTFSAEEAKAFIKDFAQETAAKSKASRARQEQELETYFAKAEKSFRSQGRLSTDIGAGTTPVWSLPIKRNWTSSVSSLELLCQEINPRR